MRVLLFLVIGLLCPGVGLGATEPGPVDAPDLAKLGIRYSLRKTTDPIPNRIHVLRIDLGANKVKPRVALGPDPDGAGPAEVALTDPRKLAAGPSVVAFINTNPWDSFPDARGRRNRSWYPGQPVDIHGLAGTGGKMRSTVAPGNTSVWFDARGGYISDTSRMINPGKPQPGSS